MDNNVNNVNNNVTVNQTPTPVPAGVPVQEQVQPVAAAKAVQEPQVQVPKEQVATQPQQPVSPVTTLTGEVVDQTLATGAARTTNQTSYTAGNQGGNVKAVPIVPAPEKLLLKSKDSIIELIRELGFDGFFDWEWTSNLRKYRENVEGELKGQFLDTSPAVGIFDIEKLKQVQTYQYSDYFEFDDFVKIYNIEKQALKNYAGTLYINDKDLYPAILYYAQDHFLFLTEKDLEEALNSISNYVKSTEFEIMNILDECLKFGISKNGKHELTEELQVRPVNRNLKEQFGKNYEKFYQKYRKLNRELHIKR